MNDFLSNLISRAINPVNVVHPLLPSRYEPVVQSELYMSANFSERPRETTPTERVQENSFVKTNSELSATSDQPVNQHSLKESHHPVETESVIERTSVLSKEPVDTVERQIVAQSNHDMPQQASSKTNDTTISPVQRVSDQERTVMETPETTGHQVSVRQTEVFEKIVVDKSVDSPSPRTTQRTILSVQERTQYEDRRADRFTPNRKVAERASHEQVPEISPEPTIKITIGRVDVRAIMQPATPVQKPTRSAPKLSLDDYLRSREGRSFVSSALAIAAVSAVLKDLLNNGLIDRNVSGQIGGNVTVTCKPPDRVVNPGSAEPNQLNLFLYHVTPNVGWRNVGLPSRNAAGDRVSNPPLALDLHYLLTAYGAEEYHSEILLGYSMQLIHEMPVLSRAAIRRSLSPTSVVTDGSDLPAAFRDLFTSELAEQIEQIKITPESMSMEEISKLWTALQTHYRPTAAYVASVVLIESHTAVRSPLPVLTRGAGDRGWVMQPSLLPPFPAITALIPPHDQPAVRLNETLTLQGIHLDGTNHSVRFVNSRLSVTNEVSVLMAASETELKITIPNAMSFWPAGLYGVSVQVQRPGETYARVTNELPVLLCPEITAINSVRGANGVVTFTVTCSPDVFPTQRVSLIVGDREITAEPHASQTPTLTFSDKSIPAGTFFVRLRVDGVDSLLIDRTVTPHVFDPTQQVIVP